MEIIEKQVEKVKEVPTDGYYGYGRRDVNGKANAGLTLGIIGTALGAWSLFGNRRSSGLLGLAGSGMGGSNININGLEAGLGTANGVTSPSAFQAWEKECEDTLALQKGLYDWALTQQSQRFADRQTLNSELFSVWKGQIDADFGLYKSTRDSFDVLNQKLTDSTFGLYKNQRDNFDALSARIDALETKQAVADAVEPWRAKVLDMRICGVDANARAGIALEAERRCCADNKIVNYVNSTFVPQTIAEPTVGTTTHTETTYNPLCGCCSPCGGRGII